MTQRLRAALAAIGFSTLACAVSAQQPPQPPTPTRVAYPKGFETGFIRYDMVDKPDRKRVRFLYINKAAAEAARPGADLPNGAVIVMEDHEVELDASGMPLMVDGRLKPTAKVIGVSVMEKRAGWGASNPFPDDLDNGDWEYAAFRPDGQSNAIPLNACHSCHLPQKGSDFLFSKTALEAALRR